MKNANERMNPPEDCQGAASARVSLRAIAMPRYPQVVACLQAWFPERIARSANCYLREDFFYYDVTWQGPSGDRC